MEVKLINHACIMIKGNKVIYFDPYQIPSEDWHYELPKADYIFVSHHHYDHYDPDSIDFLSKEDTKIIHSPKVDAFKIILKPGEEWEDNYLKVKAFPAYNKKSERLKFHPKENLGLGFLVEVEGKKFYFAGDTDCIEEICGLEVDVAFLPISGTYVMSCEEAVECALKMNARYYFPMHYFGEDPMKFLRLLEEKGKKAAIGSLTL